MRWPLLRTIPAGYLLYSRRGGDHAWTARRILLVDDNRHAADSMVLLLRTNGHEVGTAHDGPAAPGLARVQLPDVAICDIGLPGMCGLELACVLREDPGLKDSLLVALSGLWLEEGGLGFAPRKPALTPTWSSRRAGTS